LETLGRGLILGEGRAPEESLDADAAVLVLALAHRVQLAVKLRTALQIQNVGSSSKKKFECFRFLKISIFSCLVTYTYTKKLEQRQTIQPNRRIKNTQEYKAGTDEYKEWICYVNAVFNN
jgi:hypothetical protein